MKKILITILTFYSIFSQGQDLSAPLYYIGIPNANYRFDKGLQIDDTLNPKGGIWIPTITAVGGATDSILSKNQTTGIVQLRPQATGGSDWTLTGNAGINPATNFIGTTDAQPFITKTNNTEWIRTTSAGLTGIGLIAPLAKLNIKSSTPTESNLTLSAPDINTTATTQNGDFNNTTSPLTGIELTTARGYPAINDASFIPKFIRIENEIMKVILETPFAIIDFERGQCGTTIAAHADGAAIFWVFPYGFHHDPPNGGGFGSGSGGRYVFGNNVATADLTVWESGSGSGATDPVFDVNSTNRNIFRVDGAGRVAMSLGTNPATFAANTFFQVGIQATAGTDMRFDNQARLRFTNVNGGGIIEHSGGFFIQPKGSFPFGGMNIDMATYNFSEDITIFGGLQNTSGFGTVIANYVNGSGARIFSIKGKASDTATVYLRLNADTAGLGVEELYRGAGGHVMVQGYQTGLTGTSTSGVWTPTLTNVTNIAASTAYEGQWSRTDSTVICSGEVDIDVTIGVASEVGLSIPIASNFTATGNLAGTATSDAAAGLANRIRGDTTNDRAAIVFTAVSLTNDRYSFQFTYRIK